jgi:hypothetical protein
MDIGIRNLLLSSTSTARGCANIVLKTDLMLYFFDGNILVANEKRKKRLLLAELERYGIMFKAEEALKVPEEALERKLQEVKSEQYSSNRPRNWFIELYESIMLDYIDKLTAATGFFTCYPWAALFWAPYYYYYNSKKGRSN